VSPDRPIEMNKAVELLFNDCSKKYFDQAEKDRVPVGKDGQDFEDAVADEGSIELISVDR